MSILKKDRLHIRKRLSYKQARTSVIIALVLGVLISVAQIYWNYEEEILYLNTTITQVLKIVEQSSTQAAYSLDKIMAFEVLQGLFEYKAMYKATIYDDLGAILANVEGAKEKGIFRDLTDFIFGKEQKYIVELNILPPPTNFKQMGKIINVGRLEVFVDTYPAGINFLKQAAIIFFSGIFRNFILAGVLLLFYHFYLTKPFVRLEESISQIDIESPEKSILSFPKGHEEDEFAMLVKATNRLIRTIQSNIRDQIHKAVENERLQNDIIERAKRESALKAIKEELELSNNELSMALENLKKTQNKLIQSEKMAALGEMVASIAHEINTPLGIGVMGASHFEEEAKKLGSQYRDNKLTQTGFEDFLESSTDISRLIHSNLEKAYRLIKSFKQVAVDQTSEVKRVFNLNNYTNEIIHNLGARLKDTAHQIFVTCDEKLEIESYPGAYSQIIINLIQNSMFHAFDDLSEGRIDIVISEKDKHIYFEYRDNGKGVEPDILKKLFAPFFTTKVNAGGSGLGLHVVYNIVRHRFNGNVDVESKPGEGICFKIVFPILT